MYSQIDRFGASFYNSNPVYNNDPMTMCLGTNPAQMFAHGGNVDSYGQDSMPCQVYLSQRCAKNWDRACDVASMQTDPAVATMGDGAGVVGMSSGDMMLRNTAMEKYRVSMRTGENATNQCQVRSEPFSTLIPSSPILTHYVGDCIGEYAVDPATIDSDPVMNRILDRPHMFTNILNNIRDTMIRNGTFRNLEGTRLGSYYGYSMPRIMTPTIVMPTPFVYPYMTRTRLMTPYPHRRDIHYDRARPHVMESRRDRRSDRRN